MPDPSLRPLSVGLEYAGFGRRLAALILDIVILAVFLAALAPVLDTIPNHQLLGSRFALRVAGMPVLGSDVRSVLQGGITLLYFAWLEASGQQATFGKRAMGIIVANPAGDRISIARGIARYLAKFVSAAPLFLGFAVAAFTARRTALHDLIAGTVVLHRRTPDGATRARPTEQSASAAGL